MYLAKDKDGNINQLRIYENNKAVLDFDWGHDHSAKSGNKDPFIVHIHEWDYSKPKPRPKLHRGPTDAEWGKYKDLFEKIDKRLHR